VTLLQICCNLIGDQQVVAGSNRENHAAQPTVFVAERENALGSWSAA